MKAMILAAGLGSRLKPWTDHHPKALAQVNGKSLLQRNIEYLQLYGIKEVIVNVHHFAGQIIDMIDQYEGWGSRIAISDETANVLETGGGLMNAHWYFDQEDFILMNVDILTDLDLAGMLDYHRQHEAIATLAVTDRDTSRYFLFDEKNNLAGWKNVKTGAEKISVNGPVYIPKAFSGIHIIHPSIFPYISQRGKFSMVDVYLELAAAHTIKSFDHSATKFIDVGKPESVEQANALFI